MTISDYYKRVVSKLGCRSVRPYLENVAIPALSSYWNEKSVFVVEAPTGYGKTSISLTVSLYSINEEMKAIVAYPQRSLLESQYQVFRKIFSDDVLGKRYMHNPESLYLLKPVTLTTIDTLSLTMFGVPPEDLSKAAKHTSAPTGSWGHYLFSVASVGLSNIVLDEAHIMADSTKSLNFLIMLARFAIDCGRKLVIMSATMPNVVKNVIKDELRTWKDKVLFIEFTKEHQNKDTVGWVRGWDTGFIGERASKNYDIEHFPLTCGNKHESLERVLLEGVEESDAARIILVFNTVKDAVDFYNRVKHADWAARIPKLLLHSRFSEENRRDKSRELETLKTAKSYIIVATQVLEVGIDITSDFMISEIAPASSLIQRFGRFLRYSENQGKAIIWYETDKLGGLVSNKYGVSKMYKVYDWYLTMATLRNLNSLISVHVPFDYKGRKGFSCLLNGVYDNNPPTLKREEISQMYCITANLEHMSERAIRFIESNDGSFVRDELTVPLVPKSTISGSSKDYQKMIVPVPFGIFRRLSNRGLVEGMIKWNENEGELDETFILTPFDSNRFLNPSKYLRYSLRDSILAFTVNVNYDSETGLAFDDNNP
jgi:CRISPR-associated endonuclease/helicase Cas3